MSLKMTTLTQALAKTASVIEETVQTTVQEVTGPRLLQDYDLLDQVGSGGPGLAWKLYSARPRTSTPSTQYPLVCVWILDKKALSEARTRAGLSKTAEDSFFHIIRADAARLAWLRYRHPGVVHVVQGLDENKNAMAMVTEPLFASVANALGDIENVAKVPKELKGMELGLLEVKHGLLQVAESLDFLHNNAHLIHRSISPEAVFITSTGVWKLGGFGFAISSDQTTGDSNSMPPFHYPECDVEDSVLPLQPSLNYIAPELVRSKAITAGCSSDMFSFGCLAYHLIAHKPLLDCHNNVKMYINNLTYLSHEAFSVIPPELITDLQQMLSVNEASRPSASDFTGSSFFRDDIRLHALRFLDHMLEWDNMQKSEFLRALSDMWKDFDFRELRYKVLPHLTAELHNMTLQPIVLAMVLSIAEFQDKNDFEFSTLPSLVPVLNSASGETLLLLVKHADLIINKTSQEHLIAHVLPLLVRAYDDTDARIQEEVLRRTVSLAKQLDMQLVKQAILPRVHSLALRTTVAAVRANALRCLGDLVSSLDKLAILDVLQTLQRCTAVDRSAPTLMCTLGVANSIFKQNGIEFATEHVVPLLFPLLTAQQLNVQQFAKYMLFIKDIIRKIEEKRGVTVTDSVTSEVRIMPSVPNGHQSEPLQKTGTASSSAKSSSSWDEDWGPVKKGNATPSLSSETRQSSKQAIPVSQSTTIDTTPRQYSVSTPIEQTTVSCTPVDIEWPPKNSATGFGFQIGGSEKQSQNSGGISDSNFEDIDPFANWPPRSTSSAGSVGLAAKSSQGQGSSGLNTANLGFVNINNPIGSSKQNQVSSTFHINNPLEPLYQMNRASGLLAGGYPNTSNSSVNQYTGKRADLGSIFISSNSEQPTPRIAPPPSTAIGRGRGRNQGHSTPRLALRSTHAQVPSEQPSLLDLL